MRYTINLSLMEHVEAVAIALMAVMFPVLTVVAGVLA